LDDLVTLHAIGWKTCFLQNQSSSCNRNRAFFLCFCHIWSWR